MCGIAGHTGNGLADVVKKMIGGIAHRGPDDNGFYIDDRVSLGVCRLSVVDLDFGHQPVTNEDKTVCLVFNGEIYNHTELRKELEAKQHRFETDHSDTEVIVHLYEEYGENWPAYVNGMFGVAIWDKRKSKLLLYRDRLGKKPLYYSIKNGQLIFGSEIKALLVHPDVSKKLNYNALYNYFSLKNISAPDTVYTDINQLIPGQVLVWNEGHVQTRSYWLPDFTPFPYDISEFEASTELYRLLNDSVKIRMQCDVPYGAYLSGGVDSSAIVSLMSMQQSKPVITFCMGYEDDAKGQFVGKKQDIQYAARMADILGTEHHELIINANKFANMMPEVLGAFDEPFSGTISTFFLSALIKKYVKVAISGDGADELFGSYLTHRLSFPIDYYLESRCKGKVEWEDFNNDERRLLYPFDSEKQFYFMKSIASEQIATWRDKLSVFTIEERKKLFSPDFFQIMDESEGRNYYDKIALNLSANDALNKTLEIDQREILPNQILPFVDRLSMAHSIEVRCPYLDYRFVEFANRIPGKLKIKNGMNKYILKKTVGSILPEDLINRPKEGFVQPVYTWMHDDILKKLILYSLEELPLSIFNIDYVRIIRDQYERGNHFANAKIWNLVCFSIWYQGAVI